jgi:hypothetical protein
MNSLSERALIRTLHLVLSIPIIGFIYGPVAHIPPAASFTRFIAVPVVALSGIWMWQKPRFALASFATLSEAIRRLGKMPWLPVLTAPHCLLLTAYCLPPSLLALYLGKRQRSVIPLQFEAQRFDY